MGVLHIRNVDEVIDKLESFFYDPEGAAYTGFPLYSPDIGFNMLDVRRKYAGVKCWEELVTYERMGKYMSGGFIELSKIEDKAFIFLMTVSGTPETLENESEMISAYKVTGVLQKEGNGLSCTASVEYNVTDQSGEADEEPRYEVLYIKSPASFDRDLIQKDALTLKSVSAAMISQMVSRDEAINFMQKCEKDVCDLAEKLRRRYREEMNSGKRPMEDGLSQLEKIDKWVSGTRSPLRNAMNGLVTGNEDFLLKAMSSVSLSDAYLSFLEDPSFVKRRLRLKPRVNDYLAD